MIDLPLQNVYCVDIHFNSYYKRRRPQRQVIATSFNKNKYIFSDINNYLSYINEIIGKGDIKICFIGIANDDSLIERLFFKGYIYTQYPKWQVYVLKTDDLFDGSKTNIIFSCDLIFVGGGRTSTLISIFEEAHFSLKLRNAYEAGVIMGGVSAGLLCWFKNGVTDSFSELSRINCLNFLPFSATPHYQLEERKQLFKSLVGNNKLNQGYGVPDGNIVHFIDESLHNTTGSRDLTEFVY